MKSFVSWSYRLDEAKWVSVTHGWRFVKILVSHKFVDKTGIRLELEQAKPRFIELFFPPQIRISSAFGEGPRVGLPDVDKALRPRFDTVFINHLRLSEFICG